MAGETYARVVERFIDDSEVEVVIGGADRVLAEDEFGYRFDPEVPNKDDEKWITHLSWTAYCRTKEAKKKPFTFEDFRRAHLGNREANEPSPEVSAPV